MKCEDDITIQQPPTPAYPRQSVLKQSEMIKQTGQPTWSPLASQHYISVRRERGLFVQFPKTQERFELQMRTEKAGLLRPSREKDSEAKQRGQRIEESAYITVDQGARLLQTPF